MKQHIISFLTTTFCVAVATTASGATFDLAAASDVFTPSFRGEGNTTYLGWDVFGSPGDTVLNDTTPDVGTGAGSFVTTNGEDHQSGSLNYYSGGGSVAEDVTFATDGVPGSGFTTVLVQATTLFGGWGADIEFGPIDGVAPTQVLQTTNAIGSGQLFVRYELPGNSATETFSIATAVGGNPTSLGLFVIDTLWSPTGFAPDTAIATPEPSSFAMVLCYAMACGFGRRQGGHDV
ncbi:hypothetical protein Pla108_18850 [Botrimarina colliarenosi]|uniref:PEP-CTERM protein-sorting domain-containing protein n=1 Tax=Botrimarina colliarenosi TaxID=2528001 RepID=A0A5C6AHP6_9BACT|nr:hypothetical protein [Botrimarina colliarenosi]TWT97733.1 hypothetical protein Pla108_18850 [Botrimarina colliarenosi]